ncbi:hypothetical protein FC756_22615 [Lysinibacillus mangiferihumi]|uniref:Uncharacterized protein n=1 Tax=Lysinibacillus mangiferihumi TaxID=1130819 RepID=A0A4U2Y3E5_9BACI|nr:hypothetical protein [Lysinibacillus mangiferihumi]TKI53671.1 hypothetical protein FC756_22615 [Lysinibacillus mangiferihumi]
MKGKLVFTIGLTGVLAFTIGFAKYNIGSAEEQTLVASEQTDITTVITKEEQKMVENMSVKEGFVPQENGTGFFFNKGEPTEKKDVTAVITAHEQNTIEKMSIEEGFIPQENGTGFFFIKEK